jgi:hypothetical protein
MKLIERQIGGNFTGRGEIPGESEPGEDKPRPYNPFGLRRRGGVYPRPQTHVAVLNNVGGVYTRP